jgi:ribonuclease P protein component
LACDVVAADALIGSFYLLCARDGGSYNFQRMSQKHFAFSKSRRLTGSDFEYIKKHGRTERGTLLALSFVFHNSKALRAGFITSRAIGRAVVRNRVRRRLREIVRRHQHEMVGGPWVVTIARRNAAAASYEQLEGEWLRLARRASILSA